MQARRKKRRFRIKRLVLIGAVCAVACVFFNQQRTINHYNGQIAEIQEKINEQQELKKELEDQEAYSASPEFYEKIARETLGFVKADEKVFIDAGSN
ncbi:MAG: septum formation initiator family protein [Ruminococcaceae bacterium]|nr:septum formation initiator family protein [Oscillospiraceae bacterium]